uniref:Uncharacterized protein n=1 Tax=Romanomermis culicivorax TaxID=13658 RepID=A0A915IC69_ROMCU
MTFLYQKFTFFGLFSAKKTRFLWLADFNHLVNHWGVTTSGRPNGPDLVEKWPGLGRAFSAIEG